MKSLILSIATLCFFGLNFEVKAQTLPTNDFGFSFQNRQKQQLLQNQKTGSSAENLLTDCSTTWLLVPALPNDPTTKQDLPLGDVRPLLESFITNGEALGAFYIGKATVCEINCTPQVSAYGTPAGINYGAFMDGGNYTSYVIDRPGKYIVIAQSLNGNCYLAETFYVSCDADTSNFVDSNVVATLQLDICDELAAQIQATSLSDLSNITFDLSVAPNPTSMTVKVLLDADGLSVFEKLQIVSLTGQILLETTATEINVSELPSSTYIARIVFTKNLIVNQKFVKQ